MHQACTNHIPKRESFEEHLSKKKFNFFNQKHHEGTLELEISQPQRASLGSCVCLFIFSLAGMQFLVGRKRLVT